MNQHQHVEPENLHIEEDKLDTPMIALVGLASVLFLIIIVVLMQSWYYSVERTERFQKIISQPPVEYTKLVSEQQEQLNSYKWIDQKNGVVQIPIDLAMEKVVQDYKDSSHSPQK